MNAPFVIERRESEPRVADIVDMVAQEYRTNAQALRSARRTADLVAPRQLCMWLARELTSQSLPMIGERLGGRDHTTVMYGVSQVEKKIATDRDFARRAKAFRHRLGEEARERALRAFLSESETNDRVVARAVAFVEAMERWVAARDCGVRPPADAYRALRDAARALSAGSQFATEEQMHDDARN